MSLPQQTIENDNPIKDEEKKPLPSLLKDLSRPDPFRLEAAKIVATLFAGVDLKSPRVFEESVVMVERVLKRQPPRIDDPTVNTQ